MAMSVTISEITYSRVKKIIFTWVSAADGSFSGTTTKPYDGRVVGLTTIPAGGGSAPTDNYDFVITDADGHDVLLGAGANRDTANTEQVTEASLSAVAGSPLTITGSNAGSTKGGVVILWIV